MNKRILIIFMFLIIFCLTACGEETSESININVENENETITFSSNNPLENFIHIQGYLYYNEYTKIVYYIYAEGILDQKTSRMCAFYAPNGLPYKWNIEKQSLEEINFN